MSRTKQRQLPKANLPAAAPASTVLPVSTTAMEAPQDRASLALTALPIIPLFLIVAAIVSYHNSFQGPFIFDDARAIPGNAAIRHLWPPWAAMLAPPNSGLTARPIVTLSF